MCALFIMDNGIIRPPACRHVKLRDPDWPDYNNFNCKYKDKGLYLYIQEIT